MNLADELFKCGSLCTPVQRQTLRRIVRTRPSRSRTRAARRHANTDAHFAAQPLRCSWCRGELLYKDSTGDHVIARRLGFRAQWIQPGRPNVVVSCLRCNQIRAIELHLLYGEVEAARGLMRKWHVAA